MLELNLPFCELKIRRNKDNTEVWDFIRRKYVCLTPEENVRQHFVKYLVYYKGYPASHLMNEVTLNLNGLSKRCDTVAYDRQLIPRVIVEYKAPHIQIDQRVFTQVSRYNMVLKVDYLIVSNGLKHYCIRMNYEEGSYDFVNEIPNYTSL